MAGKKREEGRGTARWAATFGFLPRPIDYLTYVQMDLNIDRVERRSSNSTALGVQLANDTGPLDFAWADAVARDMLEAESLVYEENRKRAAQRQRARMDAMWEAQR